MSMVVSWMQTNFFSSYHEARYNAYTEVSYFFVFVALLNAVLTVLAFYWLDTKAVSTVANGDVCKQLNTGFYLSAFLCLIDALVNGLLAASVTFVMKRWCSYVALTAMGFAVLMIIVKSLTMGMGLFLLFDDDHLGTCEKTVPGLFGHAYLYLVVSASAFALQLFGGFLMTNFCGLDQALQEGLRRNVLSDPGDLTDEDGDNLEEDQDTRDINSPLLGL